MITLEVFGFFDDDGANPTFPSRLPSDTFIDDISFTSVSVFKTFSNLKNRSAAGPDKNQVCIL